MEKRRKVFGVPLLEKSMQKDGDSLLVRGYFTSDNKDELGDIITREATEKAIPAFRQWGNIRYMHQPRPVGKVVKIGTEDGLEWNEVEIKVVDPEAKFQVENGLLSALSVGIIFDFDSIDILQDGGWVINDYQFSEISLVDHPANYDAVLQNAMQDSTVRDLVRENGVSRVVRSFDVLTKKDKEKIMAKKEKELEATEQIAPVEEEVIEEPVVEEEEVVEEPVSEEEAIEEEIAPVEEEEEEGKEESLEESEPAEEEEAIEEVEESEEVVEEEEEEIEEVEEVAEEEKSLSGSEHKTKKEIEVKEGAEIKSLSDKLDKFIDIVTKLLDVEQPVKEEATEEESVDPAVAELLLQVKALTDRVSELEQPEGRVGKILSEDEEEHKDLEPDTLKSAVEKMFRK